MIKNSIITVKNVLFSLFCLIILSCRGNVIATDSDLSNFGWALYEKGEYLEALEWFKESIETDSSHYDAYNGAGWTMGQLRQAEEAVYFFDTFLQRDSSDFKDKLDFYAGLSFGYSAVGNDIKAREYAQTYFFGNQNSDLGDPNWCFCHKTEINMLDVRLILALSEFRLGLFQNCLSSINDIYKSLGTEDEDFLKNGELNGSVELEDEYPLRYDYTTVSGRTYLANHLKILQIKLLVPKDDNEFNCSEYCDQ